MATGTGWLVLFVVQLLLHGYIQVVIGGKPSVGNTELQFVPVKCGAELVLPCQSDEDNATRTWYHNNIPVGVVLTSDFIIFSAKPNDSGWYTCRIANIDGYDTIEYFVEVIEPPVIKSDPVNVVTTEDIIIPFACVVLGVPGPDVTWYRIAPGEPPREIDPDNPDFTIRHRSDNQLEVNARIEYNGDKYYCSASNGFTTVNSSEALLTVFLLPRMPNPDSTLQPLYTLRGVTEIRTISCTPSAPSGYNITWSVNGMIMNNLMNQNTITISANSSRGVHCCEIIPESAGNPIQYCTYVLPSYIPEQVKIGVKGLSVEVGQSLGIECRSVGGVPASQLNWLNGENEEIFNDFSFTLSTYSLLEVQLSDSTEIVCQANNGLSPQLSKSIILNVIDPLTSGLSRDGPNILSNPGAEEGNSPWQFERRLPNDAKITDTNGENVFSLRYPPDITEQDIPSIVQTFDIEGNEQIIGLRLSARMRVAMPSTSNGIILPEVVVDFEGNVYELAWPSEMTEFNAWHWVSRDITITPSSARRQGEVILTLGDRGATNVGGEVYLDDISIVPLMMSGTTATDPDSLPIIIGATVGALMLVTIIILLIVFICCFCGCCVCCKRNDAIKMRKETIIKRLSKKTTRHYVPDPTKNTRAPPLGDEGQYTSLEERSEAIYTKPDDTYETVTTPGEEYEDMSGDKSIKKEEYYYIQAPASVPSNSHSSSSISGQPPRSSINSDKVKQVSLAMNDSSYVQLVDGPPLPARNKSGSDEPKTSVPPSKLQEAEGANDPPEGTKDQSEGTKDPVEGTSDQPEGVFPMTEEEEKDETTEYYEKIDIN